MKQGMQLTFFGVRGSYPVPDCRMKKIGGNSAAIMVAAGDEVAFLDAGTGIISAGRLLQRLPRPPSLVSIFLTHLHIDHIQGLPFFTPIYDERFRVRIYCPLHEDVDLQATVLSLFLPPFSPVTRSGIKAAIEFFRLEPGEAAAAAPMMVGAVRVEYLWHRYHPLLGSALYRLSENSRRVVYATDIEIPGGFDAGMVDFARGADVLIHDAQYRDRDYVGSACDRRGYGHSPVSAALANAERCNAKKLFLFHYDPEYGDTVIESMLRRARRVFPKTYLAREKQKIIIRS